MPTSPFLSLPSSYSKYSKWHLIADESSDSEEESDFGNYAEFPRHSTSDVDSAVDKDDDEVEILSDTTDKVFIFYYLSHFYCNQMFYNMLSVATKA